LGILSAFAWLAFGVLLGFFADSDDLDHFIAIKLFKAR